MSGIDLGNFHCALLFEASHEEIERSQCELHDLTMVEARAWA